MNKFCGKPVSAINEHFVPLDKRDPLSNFKCMSIIIRSAQEHLSKMLIKFQGTTFSCNTLNLALNKIFGSACKLVAACPIYKGTSTNTYF